MHFLLIMGVMCIGISSISAKSPESIFKSDFIPDSWMEGLYLPTLNTSISLVSVSDPTSGTPGNSDIILRYLLKNEGPDSAKCVQVDFDLVGQIPTFLTMTGSLSATLGTGGVFGPTVFDPTDIVYTGNLNEDFDGGPNDSLFSNKIDLAPDQCIAIDIPFEVGDTNFVDPIIIAANATGIDTSGNAVAAMTPPFTLFAACESESLACAGEVNVSLGVDCQAVIALNTVFLNIVVDPNRYSVVVFDGDTAIGDTLNESHVGKDLTYSVLDGCFGGRASCWGNINLENKNVPQGDRYTKQELYCGEEPQELKSLEEVIADIEADCYVDLTNYVEVYGTSGGQCDTLVQTRVVLAEWEIDGWKTVDTVHVDSICFLPLEFDLVENPMGGPDKEDAIVVDCDSVGPEGATPSFLERYFNQQAATTGSGAAFGYPYIDRGTTVMEMYEDRDTIVFDTVRQEIQIDSVWVTVNVIVKDTITVTDTIRTTKPNIVPITEGTLCNWTVTYKDEYFPGCSSDSSKILRNWSILDWCEGQLYNLDQWILIEDLRGHDIETADTVRLSITPWLCTAEYQLSALVSDNCSEVRDVNWASSAGLIDSNLVLSAITVTDSPVRVSVQAVDECGNDSTKTIIFMVVDSVAPVVVTKDEISTTIIYDPINERGIAKVTAESLNQDSHDSGCGPVTLCTLLEEEYTNPIRDEAGTLVTDDDGNILYHAAQCEVDGFYEGQPYVICKDAIKLCCDQVGTHTAMLIVEDGSPYSPPGLGWTTVNVEDKSFPIVNCSDVTAACGSDLSPEVVGFPDFSSGLCNSGSLTYSDEAELGDCGEGTISRTWFIDGDSTCVQTITLSGEEAFDPKSIRWPIHYDDGQVNGIIRQCINDTLVEIIGTIEMGQSFVCDQDVVLEPVWCTSDCGSVFLTYEDMDVSDGIACKKIIRRWSVIDWCTYTPNAGEAIEDNDVFEAVSDLESNLHVTLEDGTPCTYCDKPSSTTGEDVYFRYTEVDVDGYYSYDQIIKVTDDTDPVVIAEEEVVVEVTGGATSKEDDFEGCEATTDVYATAIDLCGELELDASSARWHILIYDENDLLIDSSQQFGDTVWVTNLTATGNSIRRVVWKASDGCGNTGTAETIVEYRDIIDPVSLCITELSSATMTNGGVTIWASDFERGSYDNCSPVSFYFKNEEGAQTSSLTFTCDDIENGISTSEQIKLYVGDVAGNETFCYVTFLIDDNNNICVDSAVGAASIAGNIMTATGDMIEDASIFLNNNQTHITSVTGTYAFTGIPMASSYKISGEKNDDHLNGVSTLDLVLIQRHILALDTFATALQTFAADINNDQNVSAIDLVQLRRLLLGITADFPNNESWRFVDPEQQFASLFNPWPLREELVINDLSEDLVAQDLVGVKIGDISGNVIANSLIGENRATEIFTLQIENRALVKDEVAAIPVIFNDAQQLGALQFQLEIRNLDIIEIQSGKLEVSDLNYTQLEDGSLTFAWTDPYAQEVSGELFTIIVRSDRNQDVNSALALSRKSLLPLAYRNDNTEQIVQFNILDNEKGQLSSGLILYQNEPNPFNNETTIGYQIPESGLVQLTIFDLAGRVVFELDQTAEKGYNEIVINKNQISAQGVLYFTLQGPGGTGTRKMILLD